MMSSLRVVGLFTLLLVVGCASEERRADGAQAMRERDDFVVCPAERMQMCTREYVPVCALRAGAEAVERVTKGNRCDACADVAVEGYRPGDCASPGPESPLYLDP